MSLNRFDGSGGGGGGTQDVDIVGQTGANPLVVSDNNATARNVVLTGSTMPALPVVQTDPIEIDSATPVNVNISSPNPLPVSGTFSASATKPFITDRFQKADLINFDGTKYYIIIPLGDLGNYNGVSFRYVFNNTAQPDVASQLFDIDFNGHYYPISANTTSVLNSGQAIASHKFTTLNDVSNATGFFTPSYTPFTDASIFRPVISGAINETVTKHLGLTTTSVLVLRIDNSNGGNPNFDIQFSGQVIGE